MTLWGDLRRRGVLGINERNISFTQGENPRHLYPLVDDKLKTKALCRGASLPVAEVFGKAERHGDVKQLVAALRGKSDFVLKPAMGAMGNGILVVGEATDRGWVLSGGRTLSPEGLAYHAESIVSGLYALGGKPDVAFAEERLLVHPDFERISYDGVPDIRIIVFRGVPVLAMTRLPTKRSGGRANLHQGAVGAGVDLASGRTRFAVIGSTPVEVHPDTLEPVVGTPIPNLEQAVSVAVRATDETGLGYVGADVVIDARHGPMILELNARPGLAIQLANRTGLLPRLEAIRGQETRGLPLEDRLRVAAELAREMQ
ncbi:MAG: alpha-L-glutamate ligase-like protein [Myxococcota bacterium]